MRDGLLSSSEHFPVCEPGESLPGVAPGQDPSPTCAEEDSDSARLPGHGAEWGRSVQHPKLLKMLFAQLCPSLCDPMDCSSPGSSVHGILQARILE